ncbi:GFA family protein [Bdellovibrio bacteriovorus]|uniref:GFA family protein n=1 Tax=Bdellovibrio bacteriovorus TaxID=959 RepID=UPI0035A7375D
MKTLQGSCHCQNIQLEAGLTASPEMIQPRACDCDFCVKHHATYISDPHGSLRIKYSDESLLGFYKQGSETAEFLFCNSCGILVGVIYKTASGTYGALNSHVLEARFADELSASPKRLAKDAKTQRWQEVWFSNVLIGP